MARTGHRSWVCLLPPELEQCLDRYLQDPGDLFQMIESRPKDPALHIADGFHCDADRIRQLLLGDPGAPPQGVKVKCCVRRSDQAATS